MLQCYMSTCTTLDTITQVISLGLNKNICCFMASGETWFLSARALFRHIRCNDALLVGKIPSPWPKLYTCWQIFILGGTQDHTFVLGDQTLFLILLSYFFLVCCLQMNLRSIVASSWPIKWHDESTIVPVGYWPMTSQSFFSIFWTTVVGCNTNSEMLMIDLGCMNGATIFRHHGSIIKSQKFHWESQYAIANGTCHCHASA